MARKKLELGILSVLTAWIAVGVATPPRAQALDQPLRDPRQLWNPKPETVHHLANAKALLVDYALVRHDFRAKLPAIDRMTDRQIDQLLERGAAVISQQQVAQEVVNTPIPVDGRQSLAYRPHEYRRAHVVPLDLGSIIPLVDGMSGEIVAMHDPHSVILVDGKGSGGENPTPGFSRNGVAMLSEMVRDFLYEKMVSKVFHKIRMTTGKKYQTVGCYAVMDAGFNIKLDDGRIVRAGILLRQAHARYHAGAIGARELEDPVVLPNSLQLEIETALRHYGVTSVLPREAGEYSLTQEVDQLNLQGAEDGSVVDFGSFRVQAHFERPIAYSYSSEGHANISDQDIALRVDDPRFVQPDPSLQIPLGMWGNSATGGEIDNAFEWSEHLAQAVMHGHADRLAAQQHLHNFLDPVDAKLFPRRACRAIFATH